MANHDDHNTHLSINNTYMLRTHLKGHEGVVLCMSITDDGKLASGGMDGVRIWDLRNMVGRQNPKAPPPAQFTRPSGAGDRGPTTALAWIRREDEPDDGLIYGTAGGHIVCWKEVTNSKGATIYEESFCALTANPSEITALAFDSGTNRLAVSNRNSVVTLFRVGSKFDLHPIFSVIIKNHVPKALAFEQAGEEKDIYSFGLYDGMIYTLSGKDGKVEDSRQTGCKIGNVSANLRRGVFCIDDPAQGAALYRYNSWDRVRTYPVSVQRSMRPRQVSFVEDCKFILSGSDHGVVYIFDRRSGSMVDELRDGKGRIQAITTTEHPEKPFIFSAASCSGMDERCSISVWQKKTEILDTRPPEKSGQNQQRGTTWASVCNGCLQLCLLILALGFILQNFWLFGYFDKE